MYKPCKTAKYPNGTLPPRTFSSHQVNFNLLSTLQKQRFPLLSVLALNVLALVATTASAERNFSNLAFIHSKLRNRLSPTKVAKMCFVRNNSKALNSMESSDAAVVTAPPVQESDGDGESEIQSVHDAEDINSADDFDFQESEGEQEQDEEEAA